MAAFDWEKEVKLRWDERAQFWNERSTMMWDNGSRKNIVPFIESYLEKGSKILDVGCGDGYGSSKLQQAGYATIGMDISNEMITLAKKRVIADQISFLQGDITAIPFADNTFDGIMAITVLEWTENPALVLQELRRILKEKGLLCVGLLGPTAGPRTNGFPRLRGEMVTYNSMMPWEFQKLAAEEGFEYVDGFGVYKKAVKERHYQGLPLELKQSLSFMWVFMLKKLGD